MAKDVGVVIIYDTKNNNKPLTCHRIDAKEFLAHPSGRWAATLDGKSTAVGDAEKINTDSDSGETMKLKTSSLKTLQAMALKAGIEGYEKMNKADLVVALGAK